MEDRRSVIISAIIGILVLTLIIGVIIYLIRFILNRQAPVNRPTPTPIVNVTPTPVVLRSPTPIPASSSIPSNVKRFQGNGFEVFYPNNWGILACGNSANFELDPTSSQEIRNAVCDYARKPVTFLVGENSCVGGENGQKGGILFSKIVKETEVGVNYKWCTKTTPPLEITHRVSSAGGRATSAQDYSSQVEELISKLRFGSAI